MLVYSASAADMPTPQKPYDLRSRLTRTRSHSNFALAANVGGLDDYWFKWNYSSSHTSTTER